MIKTLAKQIKEFKADSIKTPIFMILEVILEMFIPLLMASIIDDGVEAGDMKHIVIVGGIMILLAVGGLYTGIMGGKYGARASAGFAKNLREAMYANIQRFSFANIDKFSPAGLVTRMTTDVNNVQMTFMMKEQTNRVILELKNLLLWWDKAEIVMFTPLSLQKLKKLLTMNIQL